MTFCQNCGAPVEGRFCGKCGAVVTESAAGGPAAGPAGPGAQPYNAPAASAGGLSENAASALCYLLGVITGILFLVIQPYSQNRNVRFHAFQSIFLHVSWIVIVIVESIITAALPFALMMLSTLLWLVVLFGGLAVWIYMMVSAANGKRVKLPIIGDLAEKQA